MTAPLSTSSSDDAPKLAYVKIAAVALLTACLLTGLYQFYLAKSGYQTSIDDTVPFWSEKRAQVYTAHGRKALVIAGFSRAHLGLVTEILRKQFPSMNVVQLSIDAKPAYSVLKDLAEDPRFDGWILCDTPGMVGPDLSAKPWVENYRAASRDWLGVFEAADKKYNTLIKAWLSDRFIFLGSEARPVKMLYFYNKPIYVRMEYDRHRPAHYRTMLDPKDLEGMRQQLIESARPEPGFEFTAQTEAAIEKFSRTELRRFNDLMEKKGGKLIFLRMPTTGQRWVYDEIRFPKRVWDRIHEWSGITTVHFKDYPQLSEFECPDGSHLDADDAPLFTDLLAVILKGLTADGEVVNPAQSGYNQPKSVKK